jgi:hypothetical protein
MVLNGFAIFHTVELEIVGRAALELRGLTELRREWLPATSHRLNLATD